MIHVLNVMFLTACGSALHFAYAFSGNSAWVAPFVAIDESVWEHGKLLFWPLVLLALLYAALWALPLRSLMQGVATGAATAIGVMITGFYAYTAWLGYNLLVIDLLLFVASVISGYTVGWAAFRSEFAARHPVPGYVLLAILGVGFCAFSFWKPPMALFHEGAGTLSASCHHDAHCGTGSIHLLVANIGERTRRLA